ncbi:MAG: EAL domain-containing protein [Candidatus Competibacteraceae bacterium]|nr:EAL domain-containing protein [Candidatus Competibacteraceae bacterium]
MMNGIRISAPASVVARLRQLLNEYQHTEIELRARLRASEARFRDLLEMTSDWFWEQDAQFRFTYFSTGLAQTHIPSTELLGKARWELSTNLTPEQWAAHRAMLDAHQPFRKFEYCIRTDAGEERWLSINGQPQFDERGCFSGYRGAGRDITERRRTGERQRLAAAMFEAARDAIFITDTERNIVAVNPAFTALSGYSEAEVLGRNPRFLKSGRYADAHSAPLWEVVGRKGFWQGEFWNQRKDGETYAVLTTISEVRDASGRPSHYVGVATDITHQKAAEQRIEHLAYHDALTDLPNRALLGQRAELALALTARRHEALALLSLDLDRFKEINDVLSHTEGDILLVQVAARLKTLTGDTDTVCRIGGDEFVLLLPETDQERALRVADKILAAFRQPFPVARHSLRITVSIGIALYPHDGSNVTDLLKNADAALHQAKQNGRNTRTFYAQEMNAAAFERLVLESELRRAIAASQLCAYYQPKVRLSDSQIIGAEALVRWRHPDHGLIPPGRFIPLAEASDLIAELGDWMLKEVCRQQAAWRDAGLPPLTVAVNLAARHFRNSGLVAQIQGLLAAHSLPPQALELELTESSLLEIGPNTEETLLALERLGVGLAIDDFGTGYSSLSYLKRLPLTALKVDQSFVRDLVSDPDDRTLAATIIALGHGLGLQVVAEGVETDEQRRILLDQGCDLAQGYFFGQPVPAADFVAGWIRQGSSDVQDAVELTEA